MAGGDGESSFPPGSANYSTTPTQPHSRQTIEIQTLQRSIAATKDCGFRGHDSYKVLTRSYGICLLRDRSHRRCQHESRILAISYRQFGPKNATSMTTFKITTAHRSSATNTRKLQHRTCSNSRPSLHCQNTQTQDIASTFLLQGQVKLSRPSLFSNLCVSPHSQWVFGKDHFYSQSIVDCPLFIPKGACGSFPFQFSKAAGAAHYV